MRKINKIVVHSTATPAGRVVTLKKLTAGTKLGVGKA